MGLQHLMVLFSSMHPWMDRVYTFDLYAWRKNWANNINGLGLCCLKFWLFLCIIFSAYQDHWVAGSKVSVDEKTLVFQRKNPNNLCVNHKKYVLDFGTMPYLTKVTHIHLYSAIILCLMVVYQILPQLLGRYFSSYHILVITGHEYTWRIYLIWWSWPFLHTKKSHIFIY